MEFLDYFSNFVMPDGAKAEKILTYRACKTNACDHKSFMPTYEEEGKPQNLSPERKSDPSFYSLSTYENAKDVKRFASMNSEYKPPHKIAIGYTNPEHGIVQRTRERFPKIKSSHVDWWLYKDSKPYSSYKLIENFTEHLKSLQGGKTSEDLYNELKIEG